MLFLPVVHGMVHVHVRLCRPNFILLRDVSARCPCRAAWRAPRSHACFLFLSSRVYCVIDASFVVGGSNFEARLLGAAGG